MIEEKFSRKLMKILRESDTSKYVYVYLSVYLFFFEYLLEMDLICFLFYWISIDQSLVS